jgi:hypothetical protein
MENSIKRKKGLVLLGIVFALFCIGSTIAYFVAKDDAVKNTFAFGSVDTKIEETLSAGDKIVNIKNTGSVSAYVRARIAVGGVDPAVVKVTTTASSIDDDHVWILLDSGTLSMWSKSSGSNTTYDAEDFYYYLAKLAPGDTTAKPLLSKVYVGKNLSLDENNFTVNIYNESIVAKKGLNTAALIAAEF